MLLSGTVKGKYERFPSQNWQVNTGSDANKMEPASRRISRRSISTHPKRKKNADTFKKNDTPMKRLQMMLRPEWEIDFMNELKDNPDEDCVEVTRQLEGVANNYRSLEEMRYLETSEQNNNAQNISEKLTKLKRYGELINTSRRYLNPLSSYLTQFGLELNKLSGQMEFLQNRSNQLNSNIEDKKLLDAKLTPLINDLAIPPQIVKSVCKGNINRRWVENIQFIDEKREIYSNYHKRDLQTGTPVLSLHDLSRLLSILEMKCIERIRNYLILQVKRLRKPNTASQLVQKEMLEVKEIFSFLLAKNEKLANELRLAYCYTMRWYYKQHFLMYLSSLERLKIIHVDKSVLLGMPRENESTTLTGSFFPRKSRSTLPEININEYLISIPKRFETLMSRDQTAMLAQIAETNKTRYWMEEGFKNFNQALLDNVSTEYLFLNEFFGVQTLEESIKFTKLIFTPVYKMGYSYTEFLSQESSDIFGILIMVRLCQGFEYEVQHRRIPILDDYLNYQLILLWPKFQKLIDDNCTSMKKAASSSLTIKTISKNVMVPLSLTQNFGMIITNLIRLSSNLMFEIETWEPLTNSVIRLIDQFESCMKIMAGTLKDNKKHKAFLYNNFYLIYTMISNELEEEEQAEASQKEIKSSTLEAENRGVTEELEGKKTLAETEKDRFKRLVDKYSQEE